MNEPDIPRCSVHGKPTKRATCHECNAAYMRHYLCRRRKEKPGRALWDRAQKRAHRRNVAFTLPRGSFHIPKTCPALGLPLRTGSRRSSGSPSLDRIEPSRGYVPDNVRVISDRANRLKGDCSLEELRRRAVEGPIALRADYALIATYVEREQLLQEVREKAKQGGRIGAEWAKLAFYLDRLFRRSLLGP